MHANAWESIVCIFRAKQGAEGSGGGHLFFLLQPHLVGVDIRHVAGVADPVNPVASRPLSVALLPLPEQLLHTHSSAKAVTARQCQRVENHGAKL